MANRKRTRSGPAAAAAAAAAALAAAGILTGLPGRALAFGPAPPSHRSSGGPHSPSSSNSSSSSNSIPKANNYSRSHFEIPVVPASPLAPPSPPSSSSSALGAFWARGAGGSSPSDGSDGLPKKKDRRDGSGGGGGGASGGGRTRRGGKRPAPGTRVRTRSSSARYFYSAAIVNEVCGDSWRAGEEECSIDQDVWGGYGGRDLPGGRSEEAPPSSSNQQQQQQQQRAASRMVEDSLDGFIHRHALHTMNLKITSDATSKRSVLLGGNPGTVHASFDRISFPALKVSGGGTLSAEGVILNTASFLPALGRLVRRWDRPFVFRARDCALTQEDLRTSRCIRNGLSALFTRILKNLAASDTVEALDVVRIDRGARVSVHIVQVSDGKLCAKGVIQTILGTSIPFMVRTGLDISDSGHVLKFPGLEVTLNPQNPLLQVVMPLHVVHSVDLDLGDNARIDSVRIDRKRQQIRVSMRATITPSGTKGAAGGRGGGGPIWIKRARYACDVGRWLTRNWFLA